MPNFQKGGKPSKSQVILMKTKPSNSSHQRTLLQKFQGPMYKNVEFYISCQKEDYGSLLILFFVCLLFFFAFFCSFSRGVVISNSNCRLVEGLFYRDLKVLLPFFCDKKCWRVANCKCFKLLRKIKKKTSFCK